MCYDSVLVRVGDVERQPPCDGLLERGAPKVHSILVVLDAPLELGRHGRDADAFDIVCMRLHDVLHHLSLGWSLTGHLQKTVPYAPKTVQGFHHLSHRENANLRSPLSSNQE